MKHLTSGVEPHRVHIARESPWIGILIQLLPWVVPIALAWWFFMRQLRRAPPHRLLTETEAEALAENDWALAHYHLAKGDRAKGIQHLRAIGACFPKTTWAGKAQEKLRKLAG